MKERQGFSLVELSIVLVVIGLIAGGVLSSKNLIRSAEVKSVTSQLTNYKRAVKIFQDKYKARPGDMYNATSVWTAANAVPATCATTASTGAETCNGDGNGLVSGTATSHENFRFWQHLVNAGLIEGKYAGITVPGGELPGAYRNCLGGYNVPSGKISNSEFHIWNLGYLPAPGGGWAYEGDYGHIFLFGQKDPNGDIPEFEILTPKEAFSLDSKIDDGIPSTGNMRTYKNFTNCVTTAVVATAQYKLDYASPACQAIFLSGF